MSLLGTVETSTGRNHRLAALHQLIHTQNRLIIEASTYIKVSSSHMDLQLLQFRTSCPVFV